MGIAPSPSLSLCTGGFEPSSPSPPPPKLAACSALVRAPESLRPGLFICGVRSLRPSEFILTCGLARLYVRARQACGLNLLYKLAASRRCSVWVGVIPGCIGQARWEGVSSRSLHLHSWYQYFFGMDYESSIIFFRIALRLQSDYLFASVQVNQVGLVAVDYFTP